MFNEFKLMVSASCNLEPSSVLFFLNYYYYYLGATIAIITVMVPRSSDANLGRSSQAPIRAGGKRIRKSRGVLLFSFLFGRQQGGKKTRTAA